MEFLLAASIILRITALVGALVLLWRDRSRRMAILVGVIALAVVRGLQLVAQALSPPEAASQLAADP